MRHVSARIVSDSGAGKSAGACIPRPGTAGAPLAEVRRIAILLAREVRETPAPLSLLDAPPSGARPRRGRVRRIADGLRARHRQGLIASRSSPRARRSAPGRRRSSPTSSGLRKIEVNKVEIKASHVHEIEMEREGEAECLRPDRAGRIHLGLQGSREQGHGRQVRREMTAPPRHSPPQDVGALTVRAVTRRTGDNAIEPGLPRRAWGFTADRLPPPARRGDTSARDLGAAD